jgi:hypothetical protein
MPPARYELKGPPWRLVFRAKTDHEGGPSSPSRHVLDAICHMRINLRELAKSVQERLRDAESARGSCERAARVREAC